MNKIIIKLACALLLQVCCGIQAAEVALIIDDVGNNRGDHRVLQLPSQVALSILPNKPLSQHYSKLAASGGHEVMMHVPMESLAGNRLGPGALTSDMHPRLIQEILRNGLATVPDAVGLNNHMGSKLTQLTLPMQATMAFLQSQQMYFIDSRTTRYSKAERIARQHGVPTTKRHVFLDHHANAKHIDMQFRRLLRLAQKYGQAVGIAHPYPESVDYLKTALSQLQHTNIRLVRPSEIVFAQQLAQQKDAEGAESGAMQD